MRDRLSEIVFEERDAVLVARIEGDVDGSNAMDLARALGQRLPSSADGLVLDLSDVVYLDSAGIELLFSLARQLGDRRQRLHLGVPTSSPVRLVLEICDITAVAPMSESAAEAVAEISVADG